MCNINMCSPPSRCSSFLSSLQVAFLADKDLLSEQEEDMAVDLLLQRNTSVLTLFAAFDTAKETGAPMEAKSAGRLAKHLRRLL
jgi:hypothetical protein